jgi:hypothetical protein
MNKKQPEWQTIKDYGERLNVGWSRAQQLVAKLPSQYTLNHPSGRVIMVRADAPDIRKANGRPRGK